jgi:excisionase family DNA binding protein
MPKPSLMTVKEVAAALRVSRGTAYTLIASGQIKSVRIGRLIRVTPRAFEEFIEASQFEPGW